MVFSKQYIKKLLKKIIVELKAVSVLSSTHKAQVINYLKASSNEIGLLINFGNNSLKWERVSCFNSQKNR